MGRQASMVESAGMIERCHEFMRVVMESSGMLSVSRVLGFIGAQLA
jgi:hypothetical protein